MTLHTKGELLSDLGTEAAKSLWWYNVTSLYWHTSPTHEVRKNHPICMCGHADITYE